MTAFPPETLHFLTGITANNEKAWFEANRALYDQGYVAAGKAFVEAIGPRLAELAPGVRYEPRIGGSMMRINRDIRFSKDKRPYKTHLDLWFWLGERRGWDNPGFWFRMTPDGVQLGSGIHAFDKPMLESFRQSVIHPRSGRTLAELAQSLKAGGYEIGGLTRKRPPAGFSTEPERAHFLLHEGLYAATSLPVAAALSEGFADVVLAHFQATASLNNWLATEVVG